MSKANVFYKPSMFAVLLKKIVSYAEFLPTGVYNRIYNRGFLAYRLLLRLLYLRHLLYARLVRVRHQFERASAVYAVMPYSLVGTPGLEATYDAVMDVEERQIKGNVVECGVAQGGSIALMALASQSYGKSRQFWLFDSFEGLPEPGEQDYVDGTTGFHVRTLPAGSCLGQQAEVEKLLFGKLDFDRTSFVLVKGWFEDTIAPNADRIGEISVLRIDADWYESVKCCLDHLYDKVVPSGYVIIDDYGTCFGAYKAVNEFLQDRSIRVELRHDGRGGCLFIKPMQHD